MDDKYLLLSQRSQIIFLSINNLKKEKVIKNIDFIRESNNLVLINDFALVNCNKGIEIISIKNKEIIQYIQDDEYYVHKNLIKSDDNYIYILNSFGFLFKYKFYECSLLLLEKISIGIPNNLAYFTFDDKNILVINDTKFILGNTIFKLIKKIKK